MAYIVYWLLACAVTYLLSDLPQQAGAVFLIFFAAFALAIVPGSTGRK